MATNVVGGFGQDEWVAPVVPVNDEGADLRAEVAHGSEGAATDCLSFDHAEPDLDQVER